MAEEAPGTQRHYRAPCPGCGAPVEFRSAQSAYAVCGYCHSTVARSGEVLSRIGKMAELFDDHSPLQLMASGRIALAGQDTAFTLVGRLQYKASVGTWTEWSAMLPDGTLAWLGEDNGAYVFSQPQPPHKPLPAASAFTVGKSATINGKPYAIAFNEQVALIAAEGELPKLPPLGQAFAMVELRSADGEVLSLDYGSTPPAASLGRAVRLEDLRLTGLRDESARDEKARQFNCPHCGAPVQVALASTRSITCGSCHSIIDLGSGVGGELRSALQDEPVQPLIPLGSMGLLQGARWQVVGFQHRMGLAPGDDEQFGWTEYLLYNLQRGFAFLVDSQEGWSVVAPTTGAPLVNEARGTAVYQGTVYQQQYAYQAETTYAEGEFYWPVARGQKTSNRDYAAGNKLLSMERTPTEVTWSAGSRIASDAVAQAFKLDDKKDLLKRSDPAPLSAAKGVGCGTIVLVVFVVMVLLILLTTCSTRCDPRYENCAASRTSGGSYGGFSTGGGHK
ncbi:DUF4178 domain-containing protein [Ramlibacter sp. H39-3-26]|uniref:DUF4178 domain-containing protein n=1 Tax=Curvibacter soli TaxID=3031331 RepID=UPI0023DB0DBD|nr:DUF4178 domain-containing protein [Ramlibacter sp. H39-3-26]MDF1485573.1 DUF4178 domain-containing protein [Ramlibacter sp. H39-3-26]